MPSLKGMQVTERNVKVLVITGGYCTWILQIQGTESTMSEKCTLIKLMYKSYCPVAM